MKFKLLRHSFLMVKKNIKSYLMLSLAVLISFTILLCYYIFTDSELYNEYKELFYQQENTVILTFLDTENLYDILQMADEMSNVNITIQVPDYQYLNQYGQLYAEIVYTQHNDFLVSEMSGSYSDHLEITKGQAEILDKYDAIISETMYDFIAETSDEMTIIVPVVNADGDTEPVTLNIVGAYAETGENQYEWDEENNCFINSNTKIITSILLLEDFSNQSNIKVEIISQDYSALETIAETTWSTGSAANNIFSLQQDAIEAKANSALSKQLVVIILYILLAFNMYGCFKNTLKDRSYEIGVRRAIGASNFDIIKQFFMESIIVLLANILICILISVNLAVLYKFVMYKLYATEWIIYLSPYSMLSFIVVTFFLAIATTLVFSVQSSLVKVVDNLKGE